MVKPKVIQRGKSGWQPVSIDSSGFTSKDLEGIVGIEELTDYSIGSKTSKKSPNKSKKDKALNKVKEKVEKKKKPKKKKKTKSKIKELKQDESSEAVVKPTSNEVSLGTNEEFESDELSAQMSAWNGLGVPQILLRALADKSFLKPTNIQALTLPPAIFGRRDILGAAETGSGKTLAFGLPILNAILQLKKSEHEKEANGRVDGITEHEGQISDEDEEVNEFDEQHDDDKVDEETEEHDEQSSDEEIDESGDIEADSDDALEDESLDDDIDNFDGTAQCVKVIDNVDCDFLPPLQSRSKSKYTQRPLYALILTPTRELAVQVSQHLKAAAKYTDISVAVVVGGLASQKQERILNHGPEIVVATPGRLWELIQEGHPHLNQVDTLRYLAIDETDRMLEKGHFEELQKILEKINLNEEIKNKRQNFVFSATLTLTHEPPRYILKNKKGKKKGKPAPARLTPAQKLASIIQTVGLTNPKVVDITEASGVAQRLTEAQIICSLEEKDYYLYYFLQRHPGRTLVFCNSIEAVRRLSQLFTLLGCGPWPLHAKMHQKHRLKNLERFCGDAKGVLLATDVAARGLDIPHVQHVIHYQTPRTAEGYVHRSGRTARAQQEGLTVLLMEPSEVNTFNRLSRTLGRDSSLPSFPVESQWMPAVKQRVNLARQLDKLELQARRINTEHGWFDKLVKEMDLEMSDDELPTSYSREGGNQVKKQAAALRKQLTVLLAKPLIPKGFSSKYPTQAGKLVVPLFPGSIPPNKEGYKETAVEALKQSVEDEKALKRKINNEKSKRNKRRKRLNKKQNAETADVEATPQSDEDDDENGNDSE